jgi:hypothetical protein
LHESGPLEEFLKGYHMEIEYDYGTMDRYLVVGGARMTRIPGPLWMRLNSIDHVVETEACMELIKIGVELASPRYNQQD